MPVVASDYTLAAGQSVISTDDTALKVQAFNGPTAPKVVVNGLIEAHLGASNVATAIGLHYDVPIGSSGVIDIGASGVVRAVHDRIGFAQADAIRAATSVNLTNAGRIEANSTDSAVGIANTYAQSSLTNHGAIAVNGKLATGISATNGATVLNTGLVEVVGTESAFGIALGFLGSSRPFENRGTIRAHTTQGADVGIGVRLSGDGSFTNIGVVEGAISVGLATGEQRTEVVNLGRLIGNVDMTLGVGALTNSGSVQGEVRFGARDDRYDGRQGTVTGAVNGGDGSDSLIGGAGAESLSGGAGNDTIDGGSGGADRLEGGSGVDLLSFAAYGQGVRLDVGGQTASTGASFAGFERYVGSEFDDTIIGSSVADVLAGGLGGDTVNGGAGNDSLSDVGGSNYLRGDEGDDQITGGTGFDDINGNMGNDTCVSGGGDDWVVGGRDNDSLMGSAGQNLVYGNLGNDTCDGGAGNDIVRGGQDDDVCLGGAGDDFVSGDKGSDTLTGGLGADIFHTFGEAGIDRVTDFSLAQGDRVQLDPGTQYTVSQLGGDTVVNMTGGGQMILVGVQISTLTDGWIFGA